MQKNWFLIALLALCLVPLAQAQNLRSPGEFSDYAPMKYAGSLISSTNPVSVATGATAYSDALKLYGANRLVFDVTQTSARASSGTHNVTVQVSPDGSRWATAVALTAEVGPTSTQVLNEVLTFTAAASSRLTVVGIAPTNWVRLKFTAGTPATGSAGNITFTRAFCGYSFDGVSANRRPVNVLSMTKGNVVIGTTASTYLAVAGGATGYTDGIKIGDVTKAGFMVNMLTSTGSATTHSCKVQVSPNNVDWYDPVCEGADQYVYKTIGTWGATANTCKAFVVDGFLPAKYIRLYWTSEAGKDVTLGPIYCTTY